MIAISDINHNYIIKVKKVTIRSQLKNCNTIEIANRSTNYSVF